MLAVLIDGEQFRLLQGPRELRIVLETEEAVLGAARVVGVEAIEPHQPVRLIQPVLAQQRRGCSRQGRGGSGIGLKAE